MDLCPHGKDPDACLVCWAEWNVDLEKLRIESGLSRSEFLELVRDCLAKNMII
jgi:hypothetical protein